MKSVCSVLGSLAIAGAIAGATFASIPAMAADEDVLKIEVGCVRHLVCGDGEVCRAKITYHPFLMSYLNSTLVATAKQPLAVDAATGMVSVESSGQTLPLFPVDLSVLNCRENNQFFNTYSIALSSLGDWRLVQLAQAPVCREVRDSTGRSQWIRDVKFGLIHASLSEASFKTDLMQVPCDLPIL